MRVSVFAAFAVGAALALGGAPVEAAPGQAAAKSAAAKAKSASNKTAAKKARKPAPPTPSAGVVEVANWVIASGDSGELPFMVIDKVAAQVFVFEADGELRGGAPALLGLAQGDDSVPGIGDRKLSAIQPDERTTPAGRFVAAYGWAAGAKDKILWVDYTNAISIHPVVTSNPKEQRLKRLASRSPRDNRITYGCINVSAAFYEHVVRRTFTGTRGVVYILPETEPIESVFPAITGAQTMAAVGTDPYDKRRRSQAEADAAPAPEIMEEAGSDRDPTLESGTARSLAAGEAASDATELADAPPLEEDSAVEPESLAAGAPLMIRTRPEPDRVLESVDAASHDEDAASDPSDNGP